MHGGLRKTAHRFAIDLRIVASGAEAIDLPDNSVEAVICTLVLCTVDSPERVLAEVSRILKPGGRFIFLEHVAAPQGNLAAAGFRTCFTGPGISAFEGCNTNP